MRNIFSIAQNTFKETIRDRILYGILAFALLFLISTIFLGSISLGEDIKIIKDFGLAGIYVFSLIITIFLGTSLIYKEIEKRTLYIILSKPVSVKEVIIGKFFGLWSSIIVNVFLMSVIYMAIVHFKGGGFDWLSLTSIGIMLFELAIFIALTIFFSALTTPLAGTIYSIIILYIGHSLEMLKRYTERYNGKAAQFFANAVYYILPNLEKFNFRNSVVHDIHPRSGEIIYPVIYSILYSIILLWLATITLKKRDLWAKLTAIPIFQFSVLIKLSIAIYHWSGKMINEKW